MTETTTPNSLPAASAELSLDLIITCADGLEAPLQTELTSFGIASDIKSTGRLAVTGTLRDLYTICLWSRVASRVLMLIKRKNINTEYDVAEQLYGLAKSVDWTEQFKLEQTFAIRLSVDKRVAVSQQFAMLRIKDAIADTFNEVYDSRPNVDSKNPDFSVFATVNDKLPDDGIWICCFEPQSVTKRNILHRYPLVISWLYYIAFFLYKRVMPKLFMTSRLYFDITEGKDRVLSKAEVLGRLCYCGFDIVAERKIGDLNYVIARRKFRPHIIEKRVYGILVKLNRLGKKGKKFNVYKLRTMHPYSEFLQAYIYEKYSLQEGGKFNHDIRVTTIGRFARKYWLDELPMLINLFKGDMKLVGVRPISQHYFSLYSNELQEKRVRHTPGLLPPFYADMPKTLDEIEASEMRYLTMCEEKGTVRTDFIYFWKIVCTIIFKRARSH